MVILVEAQMVRDVTLVRPAETSREDLLVVHTRRYIDSLKVSHLSVSSVS